MVRLVFVFLLLAGCSAPAMAPDLNLHDRFELVALREEDGSAAAQLLKWQSSIRVMVTGGPQYRDAVAEHLALLGELTGLQTEMDAYNPNMIVNFGPRLEDSWCRLSVGGPTGRPGLLSSEINIRTDQPDDEIQICIVQEMTQSLGLLRDLDGRDDTNFTSYGDIRELTATDRQLLAILYDDRLYSGMPRAEVLAVLPAIVADVQAEQEAANQ